MADRFFYDILKAVISGLVVSGLLWLILFIVGKNSDKKVIITSDNSIPSDSVPKSKKNKDIKLIILTFIVVAALVLVYLLTQPLEVRITDPREGTAVPMVYTVFGTVSGYTSSDDFLWVVVNPEKSPGSFWPQDRPISPWNGTWSSLTHIGNDETDRQYFNIYVVLVNEKDNQSYLDYLENGKQTNNYPDIALPQSAKKVAKISVNRQ